MHRGGYTVIPFLNSKHWTKPQNIRACECVCVCTHVCCVNVNLEKNMEGNTQIANRDDWQCGEEEGFLGLKRKNGQNICYDYTAIKESDEKLATTWIRIHHDRQECPSSTWSQSSGIFSFIELKKILVCIMSGVKNLTTNDMGSILGLGRSCEEENGNPLQYSCLGNLRDRGGWQATVQMVTKSWTQLSD